MKTRLCIFFLFIFTFSLAIAGGKREATVNNSIITVYAYDSFSADWGAGPLICKGFEDKTGIKVNMISVGDASQVLSRAILEKDMPQADVLIGIDNQLVNKAREAGILETYKPEGVDSIPSEFIIADDWILSPYDWSSFTLMFDSQSKITEPKSLQDLVNPIYEKKIILMDPRTSTPGLGFVAWTLSVLGEENFSNYWKALKPNILTMAPGWDSGYGLFTSGEAPITISYTTSAAYHVACDNIDRFKALEFTEGHVFQTEGVGLVKGASNPTGGKAFIDYVLSEEAQAMLPETQWMYPVNSNVELPTSYKAAPVPVKKLFTDNLDLEKAVNTVMSIIAE